ncbi:hypothetical protein BHE90_016796 [Fusarium euwallaceae]|uniref:Heterokaryon incompatibility domain-containing protein n=1 Tax=Fusarium euwallaceae TaxID=1147111 RepID=A0A430KZD4_9HYPO|nr:hypothetical protein BHE90_016796 [Fusarium euwallaceae]
MPSQMPRFRDRLSRLFKRRLSEVPEQSASGTFTSPAASNTSNRITTTHAVGNANTAAPSASTFNTQQGGIQQTPCASLPAESSTTAQILAQQPRSEVPDPPRPSASSTNTATTTPAQPASKAKTKAATVEDDPSSFRPVFGPERPPPGQQQEKEKKRSIWSKLKGESSSNSAAGSSKAQGADDDEEIAEFRLQVNKNLWPAFDPGEGVLANGVLNAAASLFYDFASGLHGQWGRGADFGPGYFGNHMFYSNQAASDSEYMLPARLFDLVQKRVVTASEVGKVRYATVSHVWGRTREIDGEKYGVDWKIPIRSEDKLEKMLEAARVLIGERYIWLDVLCMDQRRKNELEIAKMKGYFENATGCLVWLDDAFEEGNWNQILKALKEINKFFNLDEYSVPTMAVDNLLGGNSAFLDKKFDSVEAFKWIKKILTIETCPWFKRVWTLQEGVIPDNLFFCTPERYMTSAGTFFQAIGLCEQIAKLFLDIGAMEGFAINHELQKSELFKMLKLRQLYRTRDISYWHVVQAVRSRQCTYEQDRVFGVCGLVHGTIPIINYDRSVQGLFNDLYKAVVDDGDFSACLFLGGRSLTPDKDISMGYISPGDPKHPESHFLVLAENGLRMDGVGFDRVTRVASIIAWPGEGKLHDWSKRFPEFLNMSTETHTALASAWGMPTDTVKVGKEDNATDLVVGAWAAYGSMSGLASDGNNVLLKAFGDEFSEAFYALVPQGYLTWTKAMHLAQDRDDCANVLIWTASSEVQLAVVTEPVEGSVIVVTPSSYAEHPGHGCLICQQLPNGYLRKIGIGLGKAVNASSTGTFFMTI